MSKSVPFSGIYVHQPPAHVFIHPSHLVYTILFLVHMCTYYYGEFYIVIVAAELPHETAKRVRKADRERKCQSVICTYSCAHTITAKPDPGPSILLYCDTNVCRIPTA